MADVEGTPSVPSFPARPELLLVGIDDGKGLLPAFHEALARHPRTPGLLLEPGPDVESCFGSVTGQLALRCGIVLRTAHGKTARAAGIEGFLDGAEAVDAVAELRKARAWPGEAAPADAAAFRRGVRGRYRRPDASAEIELKLSADGRCRHVASSAGVQGSSSEEREGQWRRLDERLLVMRISSTHAALDRDFRISCSRGPRKRASRLRAPQLGDFRRK